MGYLNNDGLLYLWDRIKAKFVAQENGKGLSTNDYTTAEKEKLSGIATGANKTTIVDNLVSTDSTAALSAAQGKALKTAIDSITGDIGNLGGGDMMKATYDSNGDGIVDNASKVNGLTVETAVPANAKFTDTTYTNATTSKDGLQSAADKTKLDALPTAASLESTYAKKSDITSMYKYKGTVAGESNLPKSGQQVGDVYDIQATSSYGGAGMNVVWTGSTWDALGEVFTITAISNTEIDGICV